MRTERWAFSGTGSSVSSPIPPLEISLHVADTQPSPCRSRQVKVTWSFLGRRSIDLQSANQRNMRILVSFGLEWPNHFAAISVPIETIPKHFHFSAISANLEFCTKC